MADDKEKLAEDFHTLQKMYRNMEAMRKAYAEDSLGIIRKQRDMIEKLQRDIEGLKAEIDLESRYVQRKSVSDDMLTTLSDQIDLYTGKVTIERRNIEQLTKQMDVMKTKILDKRKTMGGVNAAKENQKMINKQIRILENRLDKALVKFNEALATNKKLRKEIDDLRQERVVFDNIYRKLEKQLQTKKKAMANIIEVSNLAYEQRDSAQIEIATIQQTMNRERQEFEEAILALNREIDSKAMSGKDRGMDRRGELTMDEERELRTAVSKGSTAVARDRAAVMATKDKVASYEEGFNKIRAATGISSIEELVATFIQNEDQNFSLFNYVAEQNNEIERLEEGITRLKEEASKHTQESGDDVHQHKQLLKDLEARLVGSDASAEKYELRFGEASKTIGSLKGGIQSLFSRIKCNERAMSELLADDSVTENNMMQFLGVIEQRTNEILQKLATKKQTKTPAEEKDEDDVPVLHAPVDMKPGQTLVSLLGHGPSTRHGAEVLGTVDPPKVEDYSSDGEESADELDARPLTMKELKDKTLRTMSRGR